MVVTSSNSERGRGLSRGVKKTPRKKSDTWKGKRVPKNREGVA